MSFSNFALECESSEHNCSSCQVGDDFIQVGMAFFVAALNWLCQGCELADW